MITKEMDVFGEGAEPGKVTEMAQDPEALVK